MPAHTGFDNLLVSLTCPRAILYERRCRRARSKCADAMGALQ